MAFTSPCITPPEPPHAEADHLLADYRRWLLGERAIRPKVAR